MHSQKERSDTMKAKLNNLLALHYQIKQLLEQVESLECKMCSPKIQIITGMPGGGGGEDRLTNYIVKKQKLEAAIKELKEKQLESFLIISLELKSLGFKKSVIQLIRLRFVEGLEWKECAKELQQTFSDENWNINKCFNTYKKLCAIYKN